MNTQQANDVSLVEVDPSAICALRTQTLVTLEANHHYFEDVRDLGPAGRRALAAIYRDAFAVLDAIGWTDDTPAPAAPVPVPLTAGHITQLARRRHDLGHTNLDRLDDVPGDAAVPPPLLTALATDREAATTLDRLAAAFAVAARAEE